MFAWLSKTFEISHSDHRTIRSMEGLRGFAVFLVFLVHYNTLIEPLLGTNVLERQLTGILRNIGNSGVDLFFVLSGYLIYGLQMRKPGQFKKYIHRRAQRIYPTFLSVFLLYLVLSALLPAQNKIPTDPIKAIIYIVENLLFLPGLFDIDPIITVAWSLSYEFFYYLAVPLLIVLTGMGRWERTTRIIFFVTLSIIGFYLAGTYGGPVRLLMFIAGILLYETIDSRAIRFPSYFGLAALIGAVIVMPGIKYFDVNGVWRFILLYISFFLLCLGCFCTDGITPRTFSWTPLRWYGNMSYSYYLIHGLTLKAAFLIFALINPFHDSAYIFWLLLIPMFIITLIPSTLLFITVEKPFSVNRRE